MDYRWRILGVLRRNLSISKNFKRKAAKTQSFYFMNTKKTKENIPLCLCAFAFEKEN